MGLFEGAAAYYQRFRSGLPDGVTGLLDTAAPVRRPRRLLDLGTGTGLAVAALLDRFDDIIAIDPDQDMLRVAEANLGRPGLTFAHCRAEEFEPPQGWQADLVTIFRAFHWMDQQAVLARLDAQVAPDGVVALVNPIVSGWESTTPWIAGVRAVVQEFLGEQRRAGDGVFSHHDRPYSEILAESAFRSVEETVVSMRQTRNADAVVGLLHSNSFAAPHLFGDRLADFDRAVRQRLAGYSDDDTFVEESEFRVLIARRPLDL